MLARHLSRSIPLRGFHTSARKRQIEAIGMIVDAAEKAQEEIKADEDKKPKKNPLLRRATPKQSPNGNGNGNQNNQHNHKKGSEGGFWSREIRDTALKAVKTAMIMTSGFAMLGFAGMVYHRLYRNHTLRKMEYAFDSFDPVLEMSTGQKQRQVGSRILRNDEQSPQDEENEGNIDNIDSTSTTASLFQESLQSDMGVSTTTAQNVDDIGADVDYHTYDNNDNSEDPCDDSDWVERPQQKLINDIINGQAGGRYFVLLGEKGSGKTSMLLHALQDAKGYNVVVVDAHGDMEIFRQRLGKALNFEFYEDYWGGLFSLRGPRENTFLDIERVFNVLEEVSVRRFVRLKRPLVLIINSAHLIPEDTEGSKLLTLLQQKAESLSGSGVATMVFNSDDYWLYQRLSRVQTRMDAISIADLHKPEALRVLRSLRRRVCAHNPTILRKSGGEISNSLAEAIYFLVGGRPQYLAAVAEHDDMIAASQRLIDREKQWFLNNCALLGPDMDDDVMDSGKFSVAGMKLAREFVKLEEESRGRLVDPKDGSYVLPRLPLWRARQIMTRPDFMREYDNLNLFTLDSESRVKPDSVVMMHAFREIVSMPGFEELLEATDDRVSQIEGLNRTRELTFKDLGGGGAKPKGALILRSVGNSSKLPDAPQGLKFKVELDMPEDHQHDEVDDDEDMMLDSVEKFYWKRRLKQLAQEEEQAAEAGAEADAAKPQ